MYQLGNPLREREVCPTLDDLVLDHMEKYDIRSAFNALISGEAVILAQDVRGPFSAFQEPFRKPLQQLEILSCGYTT
jgi:hypothetical protein